MGYLCSLSRVRVYKASDVCCMAVIGQCSSAENIVLIPRIAVAPLFQFLFVITNKKLQQVTNDLSAPAYHQLQFVTPRPTIYHIHLIIHIGIIAIFLITLSYVLLDSVRITMISIRNVFGSILLYC